MRGFFGGIERIRTAVGAFAEPSLATRPRRQYLYWMANVIKKFKVQKFKVQNLNKFSAIPQACVVQFFPKLSLQVSGHLETNPVT